MIRERVKYLHQYLANIQLNDQNSDQYVVSRTDAPDQVLKITFNSVRHEITFEKDNGPGPVHLLLRVELPSNGIPIVTRRRFGQELGKLAYAELPDEIRHAIDRLEQSHPIGD